MASLRVGRRMFSAAAAGPVPSSRWLRLKNSKAGVWVRGLVSDYIAACREIVVGSWERPLKASAYASVLAGAWACSYTRPDRSSFEATLLEYSNRLGLLSPWIRSGTTDGHVQSLVKLRNEGRLRHASLGVLSLVYRSDHDLDTTLYEAQCSSLAAPWRELPHRILDVGFVGRWWVLDSKMKDYDINEDEFKHLPPHMQVSPPPSVQEVERSERLHKESWVSPKMVEEEDETDVVIREEESVGEEGQIPAVEEKQAAA
ncbi:mitochondrial import inner membrane translocase subunit Tim29 isoform X1 [Pungitius pungitius]|uniref:mitochondrial import inner membrane translocase subunit Tim29 isoform X1 n=1 Tax=Pungitius pungitius TaxID=134920 RepID=UPI002E14C1EC